jgi:ABC-2 type transport system permease protein
VGETFTLYLRLLNLTLRGQMQYRASFILSLISTGLISLFEFGALLLVLIELETLAGWTIAELAVLYGLVEFSFGLMDNIFDGFDPRNFGQRVRLGTFDQMLLRPVPLITQIMGSRFELRRIGRIVIGFAVAAAGILVIPMQWTLWKVVLLPMMVIGMVCFFGGLFVFGSTVTFWTIESIEVMNILTYGGSYAMSHPVSIYPGWLRAFLTFIVPAIFLNYYPTLYLLDRPLPAGDWVAFLSPLVGIGVLWLAFRVFKIGIRYYQSTGS